MRNVLWVLLFSVGSGAGCGSELEGDDVGECSDGADNDADGFFDCEDSDCFGSSDCDVATNSSSSTATSTNTTTTTTVTTTATTTSSTGTTTTSGVAPMMDWHVGYGTANEEHVHEGIQTADGGFVAVGETQENAMDDRMGDILVVKIDAAGALEWTLNLGTTGVPEVGIAVAETAEKDIILGLGLAQSSQMKAALVRLNSQGDIIWQKTYPHTGHGAVRGLEVLDNGDIVATGYRSSPIGGYQFIADEGTGFLMRVDSTGEVLWDVNLPASQGTKLRATTDGGFAVASTVWVFENGTDINAGMLIKLDSAGQQEWAKTYSSVGMNQVFDFDQTTDNGFALAGHTTGYGSENWDCLLIRTDASGNVLWESQFGNPRGYNPTYIHDECYGVRQDSDGGFLMVGGTGDEYSYSENGHASGPSDEWKAYAIKTDADGALVWEAVYGDGAGQGNNAAEFMTLTADGGLLLFNDTDSAGAIAPNNFGFMKLSR